MFCYKITLKSLKKLRQKEIPVEDIEFLKELKDCEFYHRGEFLYAVEALIGKTKTDIYESIIVSCTYSKLSSRIYVLAVVIAIVLFTIIFGIVVWNNDLEKFSKLGNAYSILSSLFSALAFLGVVLAVYMQRQDLSNQRDELKLTRSEIRDQKIMVEKQNEIISSQIFEHTFFQMLHLHNSLVYSMKFECKNKENQVETHIGKISFKYYYESFIAVLNKYRREFPNNKVKMVEMSYEEWNETYQPNIGYYFRNLYNIIKFVDSNKFFGKFKENQHKEKKVYIDLVRAHLSGYELLMQFFNSFAYPNFKANIKKYDMIKGISKNELEKINLIELCDENNYGQIAG
ncbi:MAG: hypothetical protein JEZ11_00680 [Desulfobacterales bacterium]|nr:hypothetical protein [Desulfobacterales bacterium]